MQQLLIEVLGSVQGFMNQGIAYFYNLSLVNQLFIIFTAVIPFVNPIKVTGKAGTGIKVVQVTLSLIIVAVLIRTPMKNWFGLVSPFQLAMLSAVITVNNRVLVVLKREFKQIKQLWQPSIPRLVLSVRDSQSVAQ